MVKDLDEKAIKISKFSSLKKFIKRNKELSIMTVPVVVLFFIFQYIPAILSISVPFIDYNLVDGFFQSPFVGFKWFIEFFNDPMLPRLFRNTFVIAFTSFAFGFPAPIILALLLNEIRCNPFKRLAQTFTYLPHFISTVVIVGIMYSIFGSEGLVNDLLIKIGIGRQDIVGNSAWFYPLYIGSGIWQGVGWGTIIYLSSLAGIDTQLYDAAAIDGAGRFKQAIHVTLPGIAPVVVITLILATSNLLKVGFEKIYLMSSPSTMDVSDVLSYYIFRRGIQNMEFSFSSAVNLVEKVIQFALVWTANTISRKVSENSLW